MLIEYVLTRGRKEVSESLGKRLVRAKVARAVTRHMDASAQVEISERTGKPKRKYRRRDMTAE